VLAQSLLAHYCPKCASGNLQCQKAWYPTLGYGDTELSCRHCGLSLYPRTDESPRQTYYRWLMDRIRF